MKFINGELMIRAGLWAMFVAGLAFTVLNGITTMGVVATVGILLLAIDYPRKEKRNKWKSRK